MERVPVALAFTHLWPFLGLLDQLRWLQTCKRHKAETEHRLGFVHFIIFQGPPTRTCIQVLREILRKNSSMARFLVLPSSQPDRIWTAPELFDHLKPFEENVNNNWGASSSKGESNRTGRLTSSFLGIHGALLMCLAKNEMLVRTKMPPEFFSETAIGESESALEITRDLLRRSQHGPGRGAFTFCIPNTVAIIQAGGWASLKADPKAFANVHVPILEHSYSYAINKRLDPEEIRVLGSKVRRACMAKECGGGPGAKPLKGLKALASIPGGAKTQPWWLVPDKPIETHTFLTFVLPDLEQRWMRHRPKAEVHRYMFPVVQKAWALLATNPGVRLKVAQVIRDEIVRQLYGKAKTPSRLPEKLTACHIDGLIRPTGLFDQEARIRRTTITAFVARLWSALTENVILDAQKIWTIIFPPSPWDVLAFHAPWFQTKGPDDDKEELVSLFDFVKFSSLSS